MIINESVLRVHEPGHSGTSTGRASTCGTDAGRVGTGFNPLKWYSTNWTTHAVISPFYSIVE